MIVTNYFVGKSFVELVRYLFTIEGVSSFLSQRICQDPIENFFGCQRQRGGVNENPNVQSSTNTQALRVTKSPKEIAEEEIEREK